MKIMMTAMVLFSAVAVHASAGELDPVSAEIPQGLIVRFGADGKREVFKANLSNGIVTTDSAAVEAISENILPENKVESVTPGTELDNVTSNESWHWSWNSGNYGNYGHYNYGYHCGGQNYSYYPSHSYYSGGYQYNYYYTPVHYGYHSGFHYSDQSGYHYGGHSGWHGANGHPFGGY